MPPGLTLQTTVLEVPGRQEASGGKGAHPAPGSQLVKEERMLMGKQLGAGV